MSDADIDQLRLDYKNAVDKWVDTLRAEEALATPDHSMIAMEQWDAAHFRESAAHTKITESREAYKDALRALNFGIWRDAVSGLVPTDRPFSVGL